MKRWVGVDFDGTLANFDVDWANDPFAVGEPIEPMVTLVKKLIEMGEDVRIFTARMDCYHPKFRHLTPEQVKRPIEKWCVANLGKILPITNVKDYFCKLIYDDRAIQVEKNTGRLIHD